MPGVVVPGLRWAEQEQPKGNTSSSSSDGIFGVPDLPRSWKRYDDLMIFFVDSIIKFECYSEFIRIYAVDTANGSLYRVVDFRSSELTDESDFSCISVVAYGTNIYAVGGLAGYEGAGDYRNTWIFDIVDTRKWAKGPRLHSGKFMPILFTLDQRLYALDAWPNTVFDKNFEVLDLRADEKDMSWRPLDSSDLLYSRGCEIHGVAIDEKANRFYIKFGNGTRTGMWFEYDVIKDAWEYCHESESDYTNLIRSPTFFFSPILDKKIYIFDPPDAFFERYVHNDKISGSGDQLWKKMKIEGGFGDLLCYDLESGQKQVVEKHLSCPIDIGYEYFVYFVVRLKGTEDFCLVSFFWDPRAYSSAELVVYLIKSEEDKNKMTSSDPSAKKQKMTPKLTSRSYKAGKGVLYSPRQVQQPSLLDTQETLSPLSVDEGIRHDSSMSEAGPSSLASHNPSQHCDGPNSEI